MNGEVFVDTGAWLALAHDRDQYHAKARRIYPRLLADAARLITTNLVLAECHALLLKNKGREVALLFIDTLKQSPRIELVESTSALETEAVELLRRYRDQDFSFADAVSFALMKQRGIDTAFGFDRHFATAGVKLVP